MFVDLNSSFPAAYNEFKPEGITQGSIHIWRQMFLGHFWPTYLS